MACQGNSTGKGRNTTEKIYVPNPIDKETKFVLIMLACLVSVSGVIGNSLILHYKRKEKKNTVRLQRALDRAHVIYAFIQSHAYSDLLGSIIGLPVLLALLFDVARNDWDCKLYKFITFLFPSITVLNVLVIAVERYLGSFHVLLVPRKQTVRRLLACVWVFGGLSALAPAACYKNLRVDMDEHRYTIGCLYDKSVPAFGVMLYSYLVLFYVFPCIILSFVAFRVTRLLNRRRTPRRSFQHKGSRLLINVLIAFVVPYSLWVLLTALRLVINPELTYQQDTILRYVFSVIAFSNGVVNPFIYLYYSDEFLDRLRKNLRINTVQFNIGSPQRDQHSVSNHEGIEVDVVQASSPLRLSVQDIKLTKVVKNGPTSRCEATSTSSSVEVPTTSHSAITYPLPSTAQCDVPCTPPPSTPCHSTAYCDVPCTPPPTTPYLSTAHRDVPCAPQPNTSYPSNAHCDVPCTPPPNTSRPSTAHRDVPCAPQPNTSYPSNAHCDVPCTPPHNTSCPSTAHHYVPCTPPPTTPCLFTAHRDVPYTPPSTTPCLSTAHCDVPYTPPSTTPCLSTAHCDVPYSPPSTTPCLSTAHCDVPCTPPSTTPCLSTAHCDVPCTPPSTTPCLSTAHCDVPYTPPSTTPCLSTAHCDVPLHLPHPVSPLLTVMYPSIYHTLSLHCSL
ncbi:pollen-specific leucine-rich repeat extensin-like protein 3 isoform X2 [Nematostella vectensis]|uniref:pollen-specific leucine-rich repeat extensin-like protein 3 isoform X2 n=1 Tax=Nematostella vectensis TaxID=45351 RepID=UPI002076DB2D|nr:pollen-specific leucine-rich repeat extensin-like protein 3 isoform X2 [Nematostella vectensis]